jgi:hypothetical protein
MRWAVLIAAAVTSACARGHFPRPPYSAQPTSALAELREPMPPARVEAIPTRPPKKTAVWIDGEWTERRGRWAWMPGRWVDPPPDATFSPWVVVRSADGRLWHAPGVWRDAKGNPIDDPIPLSVASVESQPVVNASGEIEVTGRTLKASTKAPAR